MQCHLHSFPHLLQKCLVLKFIFLFIKVSFKFLNAAPNLHVHVITLIQFVCHFHIGCMKSLFSGSSSILSSLISTCFLQIQVYLHSEKANIFNPEPGHQINVIDVISFAHSHFHSNCINISSSCIIQGYLQSSSRNLNNLKTFCIYWNKSGELKLLFKSWELGKLGELKELRELCPQSVFVPSKQ